MSHHPMFTQRLAIAACALLTGSVVWAAGEDPPPAEPPSAPGPDAVFEPRIIRGNDQVIGAAKPVPPPEGAPSSFRFEEAPIAEVVRTMLGDILKVDYVLHPPISGSITLATQQPVAPDQAIFLLETALQANGLTMLRDPRGAYHVGRPETLKGIGAAVRQAGVGSGPLPPGSGAVLVPLQYIGAAEMATILRPMVPPEALIRVDTVRNLLVLAGSRAQAEGWLDIISTFDVNLLKGMSVGVFPLKYVSVKEVEAALQWLSTGGAPRQNNQAADRPVSAIAMPGAAPGGTAAGPADNMPLPLAGAVRVLPIERINSILVVTPRAAYLDEARRWIERLDQPSDNSAEPQLFIYQVQNVNARHLASVLSGIFGTTPAPGTAANSGVAPGLPAATTSSNSSSSPVIEGLWLGTGAIGNSQSRFGGFRSGRFGSGQATTGASGARDTPSAPAVAALGNIRVMADELNNSVLVWSTRAEYAKIESTLRRLDLPPTQVLIEASIIEVTLNDDLRYGLQWAFNDSRSGIDRGQGALSSRDGTSTGGILGGALAGFSYALKSPAGAVRAMLNVLSAKTTVKVVASPSLMVLDNHTASIAVGDQTPIQAGTTSNLEGTVTSTNIEYKDTGVNLVVTPSVNAGNIVTMQIDQSVTDVGAKDEVTNQRAFLQRQLSSKVSVRSGESIVMGGLIQENSSSTKSGIPVLHALPLFGNLFGTTVNDGRRTELLVIITPRVVRSDIDIRQVSEELRDRMKGFVGLQQPPALQPAVQD
ncbi:type II secretion system secretin GspD [Verminephrobacter eiseniae]|uniref:type II secretion system secretin GspD n=1 Tax=Verminephrobacter eiseniae TaxID=364317 RepID=UPI002237C0C1|nr:type II secretion system secretin GspD [Verminephrobacter eiseniae]